MRIYLRLSRSLRKAFATSFRKLKVRLFAVPKSTPPPLSRICRNYTTCRRCLQKHTASQPLSAGRTTSAQHLYLIPNMPALSRRRQEHVISTALRKRKITPPAVSTHMHKYSSSHIVGYALTPVLQQHSHAFLHLHPATSPCWNSGRASR